MFYIKCWDNYRKEFLYWIKIKTKTSAYYVFVNNDKSYKAGWTTVFEHPKRYTVCISFGQLDKNGVELYSGDIVRNNDNEFGIIKLSQNRGGLFVKYNGGLKYLKTNDIEKVGDIFKRYSNFKD